MLDRGDYRIVTFKVDHGVPALGYALVEEARPGRFDVATADALGVPPGPERGRLQSGEAIALADGSVVTPDQVLGPPRAGRKVLITGDTAPSLAYLDLAQGAELLVHEATFCEEERERARETSHSTAREAAQVRRGRGREAARADAPLVAVLRARGRRARRARSFRTPWCRATST